MNPLLLSRRRYLQLLDSAHLANQHRFARLAALNWLAAYPGDLAASLAYARALVGEKRLESAVSVLQGLRRADPEYLEAVELLAQIDSKDGQSAASEVGAHLFALTGRSRDRRTVSAWGGSLWLARQAIMEGKVSLADEMLRDVLRVAGDEPLAQVVHLGWLRHDPNFDPHAGREIAQAYHKRSPDCLAVMLHLADWSLQLGEEEYAVALLHQAAARDVGAQAAARVWITENPYRSLWPERLELELNLPVPAEVSALLGWNRLRSGEPGSAHSEGQLDEQRPAASLPGAEAPAAEVPVPASEPGGLPLIPVGLVLTSEQIAQPVLAEAAAAFLVMDHAGEALHAEPGGDDFSAAPIGSVEDTRPTAVRRTAASPQADLASGGIDWALAIEDDFQGVPAAVARARLVTMLGAERPVPHAVSASERRKAHPPAARKPLDPELRQVSKDMDAAARRLKLPGVGHRDGRFPVYVIFSLRGRLEAHYGAGVAALLESEMEALAQTISRRRGWNARTFLADDPTALLALGMDPVRSGDPWELKLALADLDAVLARRGECIGALLIVGGPEIVPFHHLPNPVDDQDPDVPSDNPYATRDDNYFLPEWPVGRLPGGAGMDARLLLDSLRRTRKHHAVGDEKIGWLQSLMMRIRALFGLPVAAGLSPFGATVPGASVLSSESSPAQAQGLFTQKPAAFGYTAAVWKPAALKVFSAIGHSGKVHSSPPLGYDLAANPTAHNADLPQVSGQLGYFNLHGVVDAPEWFGQRDPLDPSGAPDFPVALRPQDVLRSRQADTRRSKLETPVIVFTQACYGLHIAGRQPEHSLALSFLSAGSLAVAGCTCMSYGTIAPPLAAGDLLAHTFWQLVKQGQPAGEALRQAKIRLASEMVAIQGFLDGEDQKTLISFVLYGDPLAMVRAGGRLPKTVRYQDGLPMEAPTVCDRAVGSESGEPLPPEVLAAVRKVVARSLPGMADARLIYAHPRADCPGQGHSCPTSQLEKRTGGGNVNPRVPQPAANGAEKSAKSRLHGKNAVFGSCSLVTLSKPVTLANGAHPRIARLTLDKNGELVKLVVSR